MAQIPHAESGLDCPFHRKDMSKVCHRCPLWQQVRGTDPQTGEEVDHWSCSLALMPMLMIENSQQQRQTGAAVESFRNETVKANQTNLQAMMVLAHQRTQSNGQVPSDERLMRDIKRIGTVPIGNDGSK